MHVLCLPLRTSIRSKLISCGLSTVEDLHDFLDIEKLKTFLNVTNEDANHILSVAGPYIKNTPSAESVSDSRKYSNAKYSETVSLNSVAHLLKAGLHDVRHIVSFSSEVDRLLGGGFPLGRIAEIAGQAGSGKTQFCFQLCVDVQIPNCLGGAGAEAVFLDVEGTFVPERVEQIAEAAVQHCQRIAELSGNEYCIDSVKNFTVRNIMSHIFLFHCHNSVQLLAAAYQMKEFLHAHPNVKLIVVDSVAQCIRGEDDFKLRAKFLSSLSRIFRDLVKDFNLAMVLTNQVTTKVTGEDSGYCVPAIGSKWSHLPSVKLMLCRQNASRYVYQYKSSDSPDGFVEYCVSADGIRDRDIGNLKHINNGECNSETSISCSNDASSVNFYSIPLTSLDSPGRRNGHDIQESYLSPVVSEKSHFSKEKIPDDWIELSQRHLYGSSPDATRIVRENEEPEMEPSTWNVSLTADVQSAPESRNAYPEPSEKVSKRMGNALQETVETMLSYGAPVKAAPARKRGRVEAGDDPPAKTKCSDQQSNLTVPTDGI